MSFIDTILHMNVINRIFLSYLFIVLTTNQVAWGTDCAPLMDNYLPDVKIPEIGISAEKNSYFCFDPAANKNPDVQEQFLKLKKKNVFYANNCVKDELFDNETDQEIAALMLTVTKDQLKIYATDGSLDSSFAPRAILLTNSDNKEFIDKVIKESALLDTKLSDKDKLQIAAATVSSSLIGTVVERNIDAFKNKDGSLQRDKVTHAKVGALINIGGVAGAYWALETAGLGDKMGLSKNQKKWAILLSGTFMGMLAGYGKERFYDYYHQGSHTYDPHLKGDMGATLLGGGALNVLTGAIAFEF